MEKTYKLYIHKTPSNKVYIGITSVDISERWRHGEGYRKNEHFYRAIKKYGWENIQHTVIASCLQPETAYDMERDLISIYDSTNNKKGYNKSIGGESGNAGTKYSAEQRLKLSQQHRGKKLSQEHRKRIGHSELGTKNPNYKGRVVCVETNEIFESAASACKAKGILSTNLSACLNGRAKTAKGFHWRYEDERNKSCSAQ